MMYRCSVRRASAAFTLLELITVIVIIGILAVMLFPAIEKTRSRIEKSRCTSNLRNLRVAADLYLQQHDSIWPQINPVLIKSKHQEYALTWVKTLESFGAPHDTWICPTIQRVGGGQDYRDPKTARIDYIAMPFDQKPRTAYRWSTQPWFIEKGDMHGNGNLIIFTDGSISEMKNVRSSGRPPD